MSDEHSNKILLLEEWYEIIEPLYRSFSSNAATPAVKQARTEIVDCLDAVTGFITEFGAFGLWLVTTVLRLVSVYARNGFQIGKFQYVGGFGYDFGMSFGGVSTEELL
ncbi:hypothetical protein [Haloferax larsenii]|nr:hypothetical protein [Haloferax larsenii]